MTKKILFISTIIVGAFSLQGCLLGLVGVGGGVAKIATDPRTTGSQVDDISLYTQVNAKLNDENLKTFFKNSRINASSYNGKILLVGQAATQEQIDKANELANQVEGVEAVYNQVRIGETIGFGTISDDTWITSKVKSGLIGNSDTKARNIKVVTENGEVFLLGLVTRAEAQAAGETASKVSGVKQVNNIFTYLD